MTTSHRPPALPTVPLPEPTAAQRHVLQRIAKQRERLKERRVARLQALALAGTTGSSGVAVNESFALRAAGFARQHPWAVAGIAGVALMAGPRRLMRWAGIVLPLVMRLKR
jgi:hypothetical protein